MATDPLTMLVIDCSEPIAPATVVVMTPEQESEHRAANAPALTTAQSAQFESAEDNERLRLVAERAATDPAYAALAELALKGWTR